VIKTLSKFVNVLFCLVLSFLMKDVQAQSRYSVNDTILVPIIVYNGDTLIYREFDAVYVAGKMSAKQREAQRKWTRLRNAVYVTFPYALRAGIVINDINRKLVSVSNEQERKNYIKSREKELRKEFTTPLTNLSIYQGKVLMKLINRETGNNCYEIIKEYKGGLTARLYQTVAFFFSSSLKQPYDKNGEDVEVEKIVREVERLYGIRG